MNTSGFANAPVTKAITLATGLSSVLVQASRASRSSTRTVQGLSWISAPISLTSPSDLLFATFLLYIFRVLERQQGSRTYGAYCICVTVLALGLQAAARRHNPEWTAPSGPYHLIFASLVQYVFAVPSLSKFTVLGLKFSDKVFVYLCGLQLCLSGGARTVAAAACGTIAGLLYRCNFLGIRSLKIPRVISQALSRTVGRLLDSSASVASLQDASQQQQQQSRQTAQRTRQGGPSATQR